MNLSARNGTTSRPTDTPWAQPPGWRTGSDQAKRGLAAATGRPPNVRQAGNFRSWEGHQVRAGQVTLPARGWDSEPGKIRARSGVTLGGSLGVVARTFLFRLRAR